MKQVIILCVLCSFMGKASAQKETFDIISYTVPKGWKKEIKQNVTGLSITDKKDKSWCQVGIYKSTISKGSIEKDFENEWNELIAKTYNVTDTLQASETQEADGWKIKAGTSKFVFNGKPAAVILSVFSGYGRCVSIIATTGNQRYLQAIQDLTASVELNKPGTNSIAVVPQQTSSGQNGYAFVTTNFDDGWNATIADDWVTVKKENTTVLLHYGFSMTDDLRTDIPNNCFTKIAANRYNIKKLYNYNYSVVKDFPYHFLQADAIDKTNGKNAFISFLVVPKNGVAYCYEIITPSKNEFQQQFATMDKVEAMAGYNRFVIGPNDLLGTWQEGSGAFTQYYFVSNGNYAGMDIAVGNIKYIFEDGAHYKTDVKAVRNSTYATEKEDGTYKVTNWEITTKDQTGKVSHYTAWFEATKGGRIVHMQHKQFSSQHFQLGKLK